MAPTAERQLTTTFAVRDAKLTGFVSGRKAADFGHFLDAQGRCTIPRIIHGYYARVYRRPDLALQLAQLDAAVRKKLYRKRIDRATAERS